VKSEYNKNLATIYNSLNGIEKYKEEVEYLSKFVKKKSKILDIGCGTGTHLQMLSERGHDCVGIDISGDMICVANKNNHTKAKFLETSIENFSTTEKFDLCISLFNVVNHILELKHLSSFFQNTIGKIKINGVFIFDCFNSVAVIKDNPIPKDLGDFKVIPSYNPYTGVLNLSYTGQEQFILTNKIWDLSILIEILTSVGFEVEFYKRNTKEKLSDENYKATFICRRIK
jgi:SAM-dependent methyltransferase